EPPAGRNPGSGDQYRRGTSSRRSARLRGGTGMSRADRDHDAAVQRLTDQLGQVEVVEDRRRLPIPVVDRQVMARGWWLSAEPIIEAATTHDELDDYESDLELFIAILEALKQDAAEIEKAKRVIDRRRGELLGPPNPGRRTDLFHQPKEVPPDVSA